MTIGKLLMELIHRKDDNNEKKKKKEIHRNKVNGKVQLTIISIISSLHFKMQRLIAYSNEYYSLHT